MPQVNLQRVSVAASAEGVRQILNDFGQFSRAHNLSDDLRRRFLVALDEVLSNVIRHGRQPDGVVQVDFNLSRDRLTVTVEDDGLPFNPLDAPSSDTSSPLEQRKAGGVGIELVRRLLENVRYEQTGGRNRLTLTDGISRHPDHP